MGKKLFSAVILSLFLIITSFSVSAQEIALRTTSKYGILKGEITPQPVRPGNDLLVTLNIMNIDADEAKNIYLVVETEGPFTFKYETEKQVFIEHLVGVGSYEQDYHLLVNPDAKTGLYELDIIIRDLDGQTSFKQIVNIKVEGVPDLAITNPEVSKSTLRPGDEFNIAFTLENKGTGTAKNVRVEAVLKGLPVVPLTDNSEFIESMTPGDSRMITFPLRVSKDARTTSYQMPIEITALDETATDEITSSEIMGIEVLGDAIINLASVSTEPSVISSNTDFFLVIRVGNSGTGDAESVSAEINIPFEGVKKSFLSTIEPGEDAPLVFPLKSKGSGNYDYRLSLSYSDDLGTHSSVYDLNMYVGKAKIDILSVQNIVIVILILILLFSSLRKFVKQRK
jgi:hypothetical protein